MKGYPTDITDKEKNNGFKVTKIENPEIYGNICNIPTEKTTDAIVKEISDNERVVKVESPDKQIKYVHQVKIDGKWKPKDTYYSISQMIASGV